MILTDALDVLADIVSQSYEDVTVTTHPPGNLFLPHAWMVADPITPEAFSDAATTHTIVVTVAVAWVDWDEGWQALHTALADSTFATNLYASTDIQANILRYENIGPQLYRGQEILSFDIVIDVY